MKRHFTFLGAASSWGAAYRGPEMAPLALWTHGLAEAVEHPRILVDWHAVLEPFTQPPDHDLRLDEVYPHLSDFVHALSREIDDIVNAQPLTTPIVIGGDHSVAIGTWSGMVNAHDAHGQFGLLWIDAHMDAHTPVTSSQGKWGGHFHGMPLAHLLGKGDKALCEIGSKKPKIKGKHLVLVGARSYEEGEEKLLRDAGATIFTMADIAELGLDTVMTRAMGIVAQAPKGWGLSLDMDAFDPKDVKAVGTPEKNGIRTEAFLHWLSAAAFKSKPRAIEIVEYIPAKDRQGKSLKVISDILWLLLRK